jgi:hypothetical protein
VRGRDGGAREITVVILTDSALVGRRYLAPLYSNFYRAETAE